MRGSLTSLPLGEMELGSLNEQELGYHVTYIKINDDGENFLEIDLVNGVCVIAGIDKTAEINGLLGL